MAGLYIHIPFCRSKCAYCDFYSMPLKAPALAAAYCDALVEEFRLRHLEIREPFSTIYTGGGTPTALPGDLLPGLLGRIRELVETHNEEVALRGGMAVVDEFTVEANPEDITPEGLSRLRGCGVDRISIGIQAFDAAQLAEISRLHTPDASMSALTVLRDSGINYSADLIYGLPGQSCESWRRQLDALLAFRPPHFSAYLLSYEPGTRLYARLQKGEVAEADEALATDMYHLLADAGHRHGYRHYEISNFALPGLEARHNSSYWNLTPYLGLGCSAHSFDGFYRRYNPADTREYLRRIKTGVSASVTEEENEINRVNDYIITSLRTTAGLSAPLVGRRWGTEFLERLKTNLAPAIASGHVIRRGESFVIPEQYWLTADAILREIILEG